MSLIEKYPVWWLAGIALTVVLIIVAMLIVLWRMKKKQEEAAKRKAAQPPASDAEPQTAEPPAAPPQESPRPASPPVLAPAEGRRQMAASVSSGVEYLQKNGSQRGSGYDTPWFLALGAPQSGKSTLLESSGLPFTLHNGAADFEISEGVRWNFFRAGVVLDVPGRIFAPSGESGADDRWKALLRNIQKRRPRRPVDGVVLTLPCGELLGERAASPETLSRRSAQMADRLWEIRNQFGFSFPVYVVITQCDLIPGFSSFASELPAHLRKEIFGWSSPYKLEAAFDANWIVEAFTSVARDLNRLQSEIFVEHPDIHSPENLFLFAGRLRELQKPLLPFLGRIFKPSAYREGLQFRGLYFCGAAPEDGQIQDGQTEGAPTDLHRYRYALSTKPVIGEVLHLSSAPVTESFGENYEDEPEEKGPKAARVRPIFVSDLFTKKIFPERGIARPVTRAYAVKDRTTRTLQWVSLAVALLLIIGVWVRYSALSKLQADTLVHLDDIQKALAMSDPSRASLSHGDGPLDVMQALTGRNFKTLFFPASVVSPINDKVDTAMVPVFGRIVYQQYEQALQARAAQLSDRRVQTAPAETAPAQAGAGLVAFSAELVRLEDNIGRYNYLAGDKTGGVRSLAALARYLGFHVHTDPVDNPDWQTVLIKAQGCQFDPVTSRSGMIAKLHGLTDNAFSEWSDHDRNRLLKSVDNLSAAVNQFGNTELRTYPELDRLRNSFAEVEKNTKDPDLAWIGKKEFQLPAALERSMRSIANRTPEENPLLCDPGSGSSCDAAKLPEYARQSGARHFDGLKKEITASTTELTDALLAPPEGDLQLSKPAARLRAALDSYAKLPLVEREGSARLRITYTPGSQLYWDKAQLQKVAAWKDSWESFWSASLESGTDGVSENTRDAFREVAQAAFMDGVARAERFQQGGAAADSVESLAAEAQSFQDSATLLGTLLEQFDQMGFAKARVSLESAATSHAAALLERVDKSFAARNVYVPGGQFQRWDGETAPAVMGFELQSVEDVPQYLAVQREQVRQYGAGIRPIVEFLQQHPLPAGSRYLTFRLAAWKGIVDDLQKYELKAPGNPLASLENFIAVDLDKVSPENCAAGGLASGPASASDYFVQTRESLRRTLYSRCRVLAEQNAERRYGHLAAFFNQRLAGRFPFAAPPLEQMPTEADPQDVRGFYQLFDGSSKVIRAGLQRGAFGASRAEILAFISQMETLRPLFASLLPVAAAPSAAGGDSAAGAQPAAMSQAAEAIPQLDFIPAFRPDRTPSPEINGNRIIDWTLQVGTDSFQNGVPERLGHWNFGDPVKLTLRWAKDSPDIPKSYTPGSIVFEYRDPWSLLNMMLSHRAALRDSYPQTLMFTVPETAKDGSSNGLQAKVFVRLKVRVPGKVENLPALFFPWSAPVAQPAKPDVETAKGGGQ